MTGNEFLTAKDYEKDIALGTHSQLMKKKPVDDQFVSHFLLKQMKMCGDHIGTIGFSHNKSK